MPHGKNCSCVLACSYDRGTAQESAANQLKVSFSCWHHSCQFDALMSSKIAVFGIPGLNIFMREKGRNWHFKLLNRVWYQNLCHFST